MRGFEELDPAPFLEWNPSCRELDFEISAHVASAHQHRDLIETEAVPLHQLQQSVAGEHGLRLFVARGHEPRQFAGPVVDAAQLLPIPFRGLRQHRVGRVEDRLCTAIVAVERDDGRARKLRREIENVAHGRTTERIDALRIVTNDGHVAMRDTQPAQNPRLQHVGILVLVHQHMVVARTDHLAERL